MIKNAIKAAIALLKKSAQDLADGVSINGVPQWADEPATQDAHNHELDVIAKLDASLTHVGIIEAELISVKHLWVENAAHLARIFELESQLAKMQPVINLAHEWNSERSPKDFEEADLMKALATMSGDWPGCEGCDHQCDEPCMPATVAEIHAAIDAAIALSKGGA